ncbi:hypothetical protein [Stenotrophomonas phage BUCT627]|uniref:Uncharacterized protein n=2 Tax=Bixiavirus TaxID=3044676 RepID=A0AC61NLT4_9CAUD|nr:hypothetical protein PQD76_gp34 [Stenotrophomonas phage BUCT626]YP_010677423.1 hypothetical protein PQD77_gp017 [Stenotrophomonas phage BUCT627]QYC96623.1 hypothetical protein [Stenotrophomonas phage BUCT627]QYC96738.1 hypothetical protein [Stenotrophomonas phage BUCT626]
MSNVEHTIDFSTSVRMEEITDRIDELLADLEAHHDEQESTLSFEYALQDVCNFEDMEEEWEELKALQEIADELKGMGGDHEWNGDWYPHEIIHTDDFEERMDDMVDECYEFHKDLPSWVSIKIDYDALKQDYTVHEFDGHIFYAR